MPIIVKDVMDGGEAFNLGVAQGMVIENIGEEDVTEATYDAALVLMKSRVGTLLTL